MASARQCFSVSTQLQPVCSAPVLVTQLYHQRDSAGRLFLKQWLAKHSSTILYRADWHWAASGSVQAARVAASWVIIVAGIAIKIKHLVQSSPENSNSCMYRQWLMMISHAAISHLYQVLNLSIQWCFRLNCKRMFIYIQGILQGMIVWLMMAYQIYATKSWSSLAIVEGRKEMQTNLLWAILNYIYKREEKLRNTTKKTYHNYTKIIFFFMI